MVSESPVYELGGRPDIGVSVQGALCGHVELKAPGLGARTSRFRGHDKTQWGKFKALPNVLYTDSVEWALYRSGEAVGELVRFGDLIANGSATLDDDDVAQLNTLLQDFLSWQPVVPTNAPALAKMLARILAGPLSAGADLPQPTADERRPLGPEPDDSEAQQHLLDGLD